MLTEKSSFVHREQGKKWTIPSVLQFGFRRESDKKFHSPNLCTFKVLGYRNPKDGEWYLSGAKVAAYQAPNDLGYEYIVVKPLDKVRIKTISMYEAL